MAISVLNAVSSTWSLFFEGVGELTVGGYVVSRYVIGNKGVTMAELRDYGNIGQKWKRTREQGYPRETLIDRRFSLHPPSPRQR